MDNNDKVKSQKSKVKTDNGEKQLDEKKTEEELKKQVEEFENKHKRVLADYQNLEKRVAEEKKVWILKANKDLLLRLLPILDTLILATKQSKDEGLTVSLQQFLNVLREEGVEKIETIGKDFDPMLMECIDTAEGKEGIVIEEIRAGYKLYDQVFRPAQVKVGKGKASSN